MRLRISGRMAAVAMVSLGSVVVSGCSKSEALQAPESPASAGVMGGAAPAPMTESVASAEDAMEPEAAEEAAPAPAEMPAAKPMAKSSGAIAGSGSEAGPGRGAARRDRRRPAVVAQSGVRAGEWDDNANYREFMRYLATQDGLGLERLSLEDRRFVVVRDARGRGVPNCKVSVVDAAQRSVELTTTASGRALLFPRAEGLSGKQLFATARCQGEHARAKIALGQGDGAVELRLGGERRLPARRTVDVAFVLDTTGSMSEEIAAVKATIRKVAATLDNGQVDVRVGLVEYKDRTDEFVTRVYPMSSDLGGFSRRVGHLSASGGGDLPESMNEGVAVALSKLAWNPDAVARLAFVIADAPPHLDYPQDTGYAVSMKNASRRGIKLFTVAASGMDDLGQAVMRQMAQYTGGTNLFVLRGGAGPQSTGGGDPKSSCGGTHQSYSSGNLDALITSKIRAELRALDADPMRIAGLGKDENAKPCSERLTLASGT